MLTKRNAASGDENERHIEHATQSTDLRVKSYINPVVPFSTPELLSQFYHVTKENSSGVENAVVPERSKEE